MSYPAGWPICMCGDYCIDGKATCGRSECRLALLEGEAVDVAELVSDDDEQLDGPGVCRVCGCTEEAACSGGCIWATPAADICSRCARDGEVA